MRLPCVGRVDSVPSSPLLQSAFRVGGESAVRGQYKHGLSSLVRRTTVFAKLYKRDGTNVVTAVSGTNSERSIPRSSQARATSKAGCQRRNETTDLLIYAKETNDGASLSRRDMARGQDVPLREVRRSRTQAPGQDQAPPRVVRRRPASRVCAKPGCPEVTSNGASYCDTHAPEPWSGGSPRRYEVNGYERARRRTRVLHRHHYKCHVCGQGDADEADHVIPLAEGGQDTEENMRPIHSVPCHRTKTQDEARRARGHTP